MQEAAIPMEQADCPGSRLRSVDSQGDAGAELPAVGRMDHRQCGLPGIRIYGLPHPAQRGSSEEA